MKTLLLTLISIVALNSYAQNVNIPDALFKAYLVGNTLINTNSDAEIQVSEATTFSGMVYCPFQNISDLTGIEAFTNLTELACHENQLTSIDVTQNTALTTLNCYDNQLTSIDVTQNTALTFLWCSNNQLTSLDVSNNTALTKLAFGGNQLTSIDVTQNNALDTLDCTENQLTSLDLSQNISLTSLGCGYNQLTSLDLSQNTALTELYCVGNQFTCLNVANGYNSNFTYFNALTHPNLICIEVDDASWSTANWTNIDPQTSFSEDCNNDCSAGINELTLSKTLIQILDLMGRETTFKPNTPLIYVYDDGSTEKVFSVEY